MSALDAAPDPQVPEITVGVMFHCPNCFKTSYVTSPALDSYCVHCQEFTGLSPWRPADGDTKCQACYRPNPVWWAPHEVWNAVMGGGEGILCPACFILRADEMGIGRRGAWQLFPPASLAP